MVWGLAKSKCFQWWNEKQDIFRHSWDTKIWEKNGIDLIKPAYVVALIED